MRHRRIFTTMIIALAPVALIVVAVSDLEAFNRYQEGCNDATDCHGDFTGPMSQKGSVFPSDSKHEMRRANGQMNTECDLCHTASDNRNPFTGSSDGTANNVGLGCTGCHDAVGLRAHHAANGVAFCSGCHPSDPPPLPESTIPPYYNTVDTNAASPCNPTATPETNENWTIGDFEGLDNDGDNFYDGADSDCVASSSPGEASDPDVTPDQLIVTGHTPGTDLTFSYTTPCDTTDLRIEWGQLGAVSTYAYSGQVCSIGTSGSTTFAYPGTSIFFLTVANNGTDEGSYGRGQGGERPEDTTDVSCTPLPQNLIDRCDP